MKTSCYHSQSRRIFLTDIFKHLWPPEDVLNIWHMQIRIFWFCFPGSQGLPKCLWVLWLVSPFPFLIMWIGSAKSSTMESGDHRKMQWTELLSSLVTRIYGIGWVSLEGTRPRAATQQRLLFTLSPLWNLKIDRFNPFGFYVGIYCQHLCSSVKPVFQQLQLNCMCMSLPMCTWGPFSSKFSLSRSSQRHLVPLEYHSMSDRNKHTAQIWGSIWQNADLVQV
jgi:hypothetical protein